MALNDESKLNIAFKKLVGKAQTDSEKEASNEAKPSAISSSSTTIFADDLPNNPPKNSIYNIVTNSDGLAVGEWVRLTLVPDPSSNGHAFFARLPNSYETNSNNSLSGIYPFVNQQQLVDTSGKLQVIPTLFGIDYEAKPYIGGNAFQGTGTLIPPGDPRDWSFDYFNGVFYQQDNIGSNPDYIECFIYIGKMVSDRLSSGSSIVKCNLRDANSTVLPTGANPTIDNVAVSENDLVLFTNLTTGNNRIYQAFNVNTSVTWVAQYSFDNNSLDPSIGETVRIFDGDVYNGSLSYFNGTEFVTNDFIRLFNKDTEDYWELSSIKTLTLTQNTTNGEVFSVTETGSENWIINYSLIRGAGKKRTGQIMLTSDGSDVSITDTSTALGDLGITFTADLNSGNIRLLYTSTSGIDTTMKYFAHRWSNTGGGPASLPSYTPTSGGVPAEGAIGGIQFKGSDSNLASDVNFKWDETEKAIDLNGLKIGILEGPLTILNNQSTYTTLFSYPITNKISMIEYTIDRNTETRAGKFIVVTNGTDVDEMDEFVNTNDIGITFRAIKNGSNIDVQYISTNTGFDATYKYYRRRWD